MDAFDRLMSEWDDRLFRFLRLRGLSHADAQDTLQETFLQAWRRLRTYRDKWRFSTWLFTIAVREAGRRHRREAPEAPVAVAEEPSPLEHCVSVETRDNLWPLARQILNDAQFSALWLYYGEEFDIAEVGRAVGRSQAWVKVNLHRARRKLGDALEARNLPGRQISNAY